MNILDPAIEAYLRRMTPARHQVLADMEKLAAQRDFPIVGPLVGRLFYQYARMTGALKILELGSGYGYSAFWWALGSSAGAKIHCTDRSEENIRQGREFLERAGLGSKIEYHRGEALASMDLIPGDFDIVFMDIDKQHYPDGFLKGFPRLRKGGLFLIDNVLWSGRVLESDGTPATAGVIRLNELLYSTPGAFTTIVPIRDGVSVTLKE
jgi:caffeoyl-CoA O-methyltransferase